MTGEKLYGRTISCQVRPGTTGADEVPG